MNIVRRFDGWARTDARTIYDAEVEKRSVFATAISKGLTSKAVILGVLLILLNEALWFAGLPNLSPEQAIPIVLLPGVIYAWLLSKHLKLFRSGKVSEGVFD